jgi:formate dehydrogenase (coenzyme F420) beta subunit
MREELIQKAKELLNTKQADLILGYMRSPDGVSATPCFAESEAEAEKLIWDESCVYNLAGYLKDFPGKRAGIVVKACDLRSIVVLLQENQLKREDVVIIGVECFGVIDRKKAGQEDAKGGEGDISAKCTTCTTSLPLVYDVLIKDKSEKPTGRNEMNKDQYESIRRMEMKNAEERHEFWQDEFDRCIRCYACRQVCPMCYCPTCVANQTMPSWFSKASSPEGNLSWNVVRAMHLAGRCIDCGECERVCPVGIPLRDINKKIEKEVKELFDYEAGVKTDVKPFLASFDKDDPEDFIR